MLRAVRALGGRGPAPKNGAQSGSLPTPSVAEVSIHRPRSSDGWRVVRAGEAKVAPAIRAHGEQKSTRSASECGKSLAILGPKALQRVERRDPRCRALRGHEWSERSPRRGGCWSVERGDTLQRTASNDSLAGPQALEGCRLLAIRNDLDSPGQGWASSKSVHCARSGFRVIPRRERRGAVLTHGAR